VEQVLAFAQEAFGRRRSPASAPQIPSEPPIAEARTAKKTIQQAQSHLLLGFHAARVNDPWRHALEVLTTALSGQGGRLFGELRDKRSMAYSVSSFAVEGVDPGFFAVYMATSPHKLDDALEGIRAELTRIRDQPLPESELRRARQHLIGTHEIGLQRNGARAALLALDQCYGLGLENFLQYAQRVSAVTGEDVQQVARRVIDLERSALAVVGP
jgi:zinc protease